MDCEVEDDFHDEFFDNLDESSLLPPFISSPPPSSEFNFLSIESNSRDVSEVRMDHQEVDNFNDDYFDNIEYYSVSSEVKGGISSSFKRKVSSFRKAERNFVPFREGQKEFQEALGDLHIQPKKVVEIVNVFNNFMGNMKSTGPKVLLLTGPPGCGKRSLLEKVFKLFEFQVKRFERTAVQLYTEDQLEIYKQSYSDSFIKFLNSCTYSPYGSYTSYGIKKVNLVFIDDLPNFIFEDPSIFYNKIIDIIKANYKPIYVFLFTTSTSLEKCVHYRIFTSDVIDELQVRHVEMIPVAKTFMLKILKDYIVEKNIEVPSGVVLRSKGRPGTNKTLERIISLADGDIRQSKIIIDFCTAEESDSPGFKRRRSGGRQLINNVIENRQRRLDESFLDILEIGRSQKVDTFHALGKLFYAKRCDDKINPKVLQDHAKAEDMLPRELVNLKRPLPLKESVSDFVTYRPVATSKLLEYLFEHEHHFANDIRSLAKIYNNVLAMDSALEIDELKYSSLDEYSYEIACRSLLYYNYKSGKNKSTNNRFYHITKPTTGYKSLNEIGHRVKHLQNLATEEFTNIACHKDLADYLECEEFSRKFKV
uniref:Cell cycle checkpoint protein RAD17 n=1 Tax=Strongyloides papillosus TaxID=174720 RepID=A0A0N5BR14_STREA